MENADAAESTICDECLDGNHVYCETPYETRRTPYTGLHEPYVCCCDLVMHLVYS